jgi:hypothetical protein
LPRGHGTWLVGPCVPSARRRHAGGKAVEAQTTLGGRGDRLLLEVDAATGLGECEGPQGERLGTRCTGQASQVLGSAGGSPTLGVTADRHGDGAGCGRPGFQHTRAQSPERIGGVLERFRPAGSGPQSAHTFEERSQGAPPVVAVRVAVPRELRCLTALVGESRERSGQTSQPRRAETLTLNGQVLESERRQMASGQDRCQPRRQPGAQRQDRPGVVDRPRLVQQGGRVASVAGE